MKRHIRKIHLLLILGICLCVVSSQTSGQTVHGTVMGKTSTGMQPLEGANVFWMNTAKGTITGADGSFTLQRIPGSNRLVISYIGYRSDTIEILDQTEIHVVLEGQVALNAVDVVHRKKSSTTSLVSPLRIDQISEKELQKAACCNLSESFETTPSVDVSFTDAVTGTRQIQMLGLAGPYTQITRENMPDVRGLAAIYGLTFIPGTWIESIQLIKGTGSVVNGYESIAGQINTELRKPESAEKLYLNLYGNEGGRVEGNVHLAHRLGDGKWATGLLMHGASNRIRWDRNADGFLDHPVGNRFTVLNRWKYTGLHGTRFQTGIKVTFSDQIGGEKDFNPHKDEPQQLWGMHQELKRYEGWVKVGKIYEAFPWRSMGLQIAGVYHNENSAYGTRNYDASQRSLYLNYVYQSIFSNTNHGFKAGASMNYDDVNETLDVMTFERTEVVPGAFMEYAYTPSGNLSAVGGIRADYHNIYGLFITPRLHLRYTLKDALTFRLSGGRGRRTASIFAENIGLLASAREFIILSGEGNKPYGLDQEDAWNYGISMTYAFNLAQREGIFSADLFRTDFVNQIVVDLDYHPQQVRFYNLDGRSYSNSLQLQLDYELLPRWDLRIAYRWYDVHTTYTDGLLRKPLLAAHRFFINMAYETSNHWKFDGTVNWQGKKRIPSTVENPVEYQLPGYSPAFVVVNIQISKTWREKFEWYTGAENLLNYKQQDPILSVNDPFSPYFDASMIWGPVFGRNIYTGFRYILR